MILAGFFVLITKSIFLFLFLQGNQNAQMNLSIENKKLRWLWFISILALLIAAFSGIVRNWPIQGILLSLIYFTTGLLMANKDQKTNIRNYVILTGP